MSDQKSDGGLPEGWRVEVKVRHNGKKDKFYYDPSSGYKFSSKIEVSRFLNSGGCKRSEQKKEARNERRCSNKVVIEKSVAEGLPPGWIKKIKITTAKDGRVRRDPFYSDPVNGYVFRSMKEVHRYIKSGEVKRKTSKRKARNNKDDKSSVGASSKKRKLKINNRSRPFISDPSLKSCGIAKDEKVPDSASTGDCTPVSEHTYKHCTPRAKKRKLEVDSTPSQVRSELSFRSHEIAKHEQTPDSASARECTTVAEHTSDRCVAASRKQKLEVKGTLNPIASDQALKSCKNALDSASAGECITVSEHADDQFESVTKKRKSQANRTPSPCPITSDETLNSCEIAKEQTLNSAFTRECTIISEHASSQCGVGTESSSSEFPRDKGTNETEEKSDSTKTSVVEDPPQVVLQDKQSFEVGVMKEETKTTRVRKPRKKKDLNLPRRTSKRLAGIPVTPTPDPKATTPVHHAAFEQSNEIAASTCEPASYGQLDSELNIKPASDTSKSTEMPMELNERKHAGVNVEHARKEGLEKDGNMKLEFGVGSPPGNLVTAEHAGKLETAISGSEKPGLPLELPLEELWQDPCIAFAIKTLTGVDDSDGIKLSPGPSNYGFVGMTTSEEHISKEDVDINGSLASAEDHARDIKTSDKADEKPVSPLDMPFADAWSDPCIEFAIKTLTGAIPLDFDMVQEYLPQQVTSLQPQESSSCGSGLTLPNVGEFCQTEFLYQQFSTSEKPSFNQAAFAAPALPQPKHVNLGYSAGPSRHQLSEGRTNNRRR